MEDGGGICFYVKCGWCNCGTLIQQLCCPDLESFLHYICTLKLFPLLPTPSGTRSPSPSETILYWPSQHFLKPSHLNWLLMCLISILLLYIEAPSTVCSNVLATQQLDSLVIILWDLNKANLTQELPLGSRKLWRIYIYCTASLLTRIDEPSYTSICEDGPPGGVSTMTNPGLPLNSDSWSSRRRRRTVGATCSCAYRAHRSVDDTVNMARHLMLEHLDSTGTYARILSVDFSSALSSNVTRLL